MRMEPLAIYGEAPQEARVRGKRFTEEQIAPARKQGETGVSVAEVCRKMGIAEATFYNWKKKFSSLGVSNGPVAQG